tara:strand:+ start:1354 stop:2718 length:1365 start_codon:yes stop_codon:yes gene_type:complete
MNIDTGKKLIKEKKYLEAEKIFLGLFKRGENLLLANFFLGGIYFELQNYKKSKFHYQKSLKINPNSKEILINLGFLEQSYGKLETAKNIYQKIIDLEPNYIESYYRIYLLNSYYLKEEYKDNFYKILKNKNLTLYEKSLVNYLLSKIQKKKGNYKSEIDYLTKSHINIFNSKKEYNLQSNFYYQQIISKKYKEIIYFNLNKNLKFKKYSPIFIVGLPRSGSTLVETILSNNDKTKGLGENSVINMAIINQISSKIFAKSFDKISFELSIDYSELESYVLKAFNNIFKFSEKIRFIDKTLVNFFNIEIILKLFPNAKFLHCYRNLDDAVIAIFQSLLPSLSWAHNLDDIMSYIDNYLKVISYFKKKYPDKIMDIKLENLTDNNVKIGKDIFNFCNLNWDKNFLNFNNKKNLLIKTTSNVQLRDKVKKYDYLKYKHYKFILNAYNKKYKWLYNLKK